MKYQIKYIITLIILYSVGYIGVIKTDDPIEQISFLCVFSSLISLPIIYYKKLTIGKTNNFFKWLLVVFLISTYQPFIYIFQLIIYGPWLLFETLTFLSLLGYIIYNFHNKLCLTKLFLLILIGFELISNILLFLSVKFTFIDNIISFSIIILIGLSIMYKKNNDESRIIITPLLLPKALAIITVFLSSLIK